MDLTKIQENVVSGLAVTAIAVVFAGLVNLVTGGWLVQQMGGATRQQLNAHSTSLNDLTSTLQEAEVGPGDSGRARIAGGWPLDEWKSGSILVSVVNASGVQANSLMVVSVQRQPGGVPQQCGSAESYATGDDSLQHLSALCFYKLPADERHNLTVEFPSGGGSSVSLELKYARFPVP